MPVTALPAPIALAATFSPELARRYGQVLARDGKVLQQETPLVLVADIVRVPQSGRNSEALSEDPLLVSTMVSQTIQGIRSEGGKAAVKHFAAHTFEQDQQTVDITIDERTLREIYLPPFQAAVKAGVGTVISSSNRLNGISASENPFLIDTILRKEWGFTGFVGKTSPPAPSPSQSFLLERGGESNSASLSGSPSLNELVSGRGRELGGEVIRDTGEGKLAREIAIAGAVLLKNEKEILPLRKSDLQSAAIIGAGKSAAPWSAKNVLAALARRNNGKAPLFIEASGLEMAQAVALAKKAKTVVIFAGDDATEGKDRASLSLPGSQDALIAAVSAVNPRTIVVLSTGSCITMPWLGKAAAVLEIWYPGQEGAEAIAAMLTGEAEPGGRLPITFPKRLADSPTADPARYPGVNGKAHYSEGIFVGYRHYDKQRIAPLFPFGHGLGYTRFQFSSLNVSHGQLRFVVTNVGKRTGTAVPQVYVGPIANPPVPLEEKKLVTFTRVTLKPGESRVLNLTIPDEALAYWSPIEKKWIVPEEPRPVHVGFSSRDSQISASMDG